MHFFITINKIRDRSVTAKDRSCFVFSLYLFIDSFDLSIELSDGEQHFFWLGRSFFLSLSLSLTIRALSNPAVQFFIFIMMLRVKIDATDREHEVRFVLRV